MPLLRVLLLALVALVALLALPAAPALADGGDVIRDCEPDERIDGTYTQGEYRDALRRLPSDKDEYGNCRAVIRRAQLAALSGRGGGSSGGGTGGAGGAGAGAGGGAAGGGTGTGGGVGTGGTGGGAGGTAPAAPGTPADPLATATPDERRALDEARAGGASAVDLGGDLQVAPRSATRTPGMEGGAELPSPLVGLLAVLGALAIATLLTRLRARVVARRPA